MEKAWRLVPSEMELRISGCSRRMVPDLPQPLTQIPEGILIPESFSPDGKQLLMTEISSPKYVGLRQHWRGYCDPNSYSGAKYSKRQF